ELLLDVREETRRLGVVLLVERADDEEPVRLRERRLALAGLLREVLLLGERLAGEASDLGALVVEEGVGAADPLLELVEARLRLGELLPAETRAEDDERHVGLVGEEADDVVPGFLRLRRADLLGAVAPRALDGVVLLDRLRERREEVERLLELAGRL